MVLAMNCHIQFLASDQRPEINLYRATAGHIESTWKNLTGTAEITLPRNIRDFDKMNISQIFKRGDQVIIYLGVNGSLIEHFKGYIISTSADIPVVIKCQDEMWKLKQLSVNISMNNCYLPNLIKTIAPGYEYSVSEYKIGSVRFAKTTAAAVMQTLRDDFGIYCFFRNNTLCAGKIYSDDSVTRNINLERIVSNNLTYKTKDEKSIKLTATSTLIGGDKLTVELGEKDGEPRDFSYFNITKKEDLKALAEKDFDKIMADGFEGDIEIFGAQEVTHGDKLNISSIIYPDRQGLYYADSVITDWKDAIFHKTVEVGQKVIV